jgi:hypothetical protein
MTVPEEQAQVLIAAGQELVDETSESLWFSFFERGIPEGSVQEVHVSWRCPTVAAAEALEEAARKVGRAAGPAPPHAEARGVGYGVGVTVPFVATRENLRDVLAGMVRLGATHGAMVAGVGTMFRD